MSFNNFENYIFPSSDLLTMPNVDQHDYTEELNEKANQIIEALDSFSVKATLKGIERGPRITRFEVVPERGVKVSRILNHADDIALHLRADSIRVQAPIPGKSSIGIEIPNDTSSVVYLKELVENEEFKNSESITKLCIGKDVCGNPVFDDLASLPHLLIAGATGMGKSACINTLIFSMLLKAKPDELKFILVDPKKVEFSRYNGLPHLLVPTITDSYQAAAVLTWAIEEMNSRYELICSADVTNIDNYNKKVEENPELGDKLPKIVIIIDEFADLMYSAKDPIEGLILTIAQKARAAGIHLIIGTQRPDVSVITSTIKANIPGRIACKVPSVVDSRTILDMAGAEKLLPRGDMLYRSTRINAERVQGAYVSDEDVERVINFIKGQTSEEHYDECVIDVINTQMKKIKCAKNKERDYYESQPTTYSDNYLENSEFLRGVEIALEYGQISTALLQRKLSIGFGKAVRFIDFMESIGIVSPKNGAKPRDVLITKEEWVNNYLRPNTSANDTASDNNAFEEHYDECAIDVINTTAQKIKCEKNKERDYYESQPTTYSDNYLENSEFLRGVEIALEYGQISTALLQRKLSIGFGKAARFIDFMESVGIVSPKNGAKPRNVLITKDEWINKYLIPNTPSNDIKSDDTSSADTTCSIKVFEKYELPNADCLTVAEDSENVDVEANTLAAKMMEFFTAKEINVTIPRYFVSPKVLRFELDLMPGVSANKILSLEEKLGEYIDEPRTILEAPIPGRSVIGIEVPRKHPAAFTLDDLAKSEEFKSATSDLSICLGCDAKKHKIITDLTQTGHIMIGGATGMGKSVLMNNIILSILLKSKPEDVNFVMFDPRGVEFSRYSSLPHLYAPVIRTTDACMEMLDHISSIVDERLTLLSYTSARNLDEYNKTAKDKLQKIVMIFDEISDFFIDRNLKFTDRLSLIMMKSKPVGIYVIVASQRTSNDIFLPFFTNSITTRICLKVPTAYNSMHIIRKRGAEKLLNSGDSFMSIGGASPIRVQIPYVSTEDIQNIVSQITSQTGGANSYVFTPKANTYKKEEDLEWNSFFKSFDNDDDEDLELDIDEELEEIEDDDDEFDMTEFKKFLEKVQSEIDSRDKKTFADDDFDFSFDDIDDEDEDVTLSWHELVKVAASVVKRAYVSAEDICQFGAKNGNTANAMIAKFIEFGLLGHSDLAYMHPVYLTDAGWNKKVAELIASGVCKEMVDAEWNASVDAGAKIEKLAKRIADPDFINAVELGLVLKNFFTNTIAEKLNISHDKAAKILADMEELGIVKRDCEIDAITMKVTEYEWLSLGNQARGYALANGEA